MSSFDGIITGYADVVVDKFDGECLKAKHFLLSHCHYDHMHGLDSPHLSSLLLPLDQEADSLDADSSHSRLYCSRQSAALLSSWPKYCHLTRFLHPLDVHKRQSLGDGRTVTALPAAHCVGSVMFLLEGGDETVLYTGDFRLTRDQLTQMRSLHDDSGQPRKIDVLYADTTFCVPGKRDLPERHRSERHVVRLTKEFLALGPQHKVNIICKARLGYENIFKEMYNATGEKVCVQDNKYGLYHRIPNINRSLTTCENTRVFSLLPEDSRLRSGPVRTITVTVQYFFKSQDLDRMVVKDQSLGEEHYRVLYSTHASLREVQDMIRYLKPKRVIPFVEPSGYSKESVVTLLNAKSNDSGTLTVTETNMRLNESVDVNDLESESVRDAQHYVGGSEYSTRASCADTTDLSQAKTEWSTLGPLLTVASMKMTRKRRSRRTMLRSSSSVSEEANSGQQQPEQRWPDAR